ncbi:hypothetical protein [Acaryochloris marina]|uniref:Uncharacterized protein n=1 Tax=Acaryochloris marina (strain MBIC 11017) TaxID=329726 RepID=A8ZPD0_ACAM1|nr:hypothetical protein [Acaryochloris marina]ABW32866.1 hypothetical protein AM1_E0097 [Acaryochloris marina MBIC11017]
MGAMNSRKKSSPNYSFSLEFNPEILRIIAYVSLITLLVIGYVLTNTVVDVDPETIVIYKIFGFNHACNVIDHEPSRTVSAMLLPFWEVPFLLYVIFNFLRIQDAYRENRAPRYTFLIALYFLPLEILLTVWFRIVFVWSPEVNFLNHYLPYVGFQILLFLVAFENFLYFYAMKALPFKNNRSIALGYLSLLLVVTFLYVIIGLSLGLGYPLLEPTTNPTHRAFIQALANLYTFLVLPVPLCLSFFEMKRSPKHTLTVS